MKNLKKPTYSQKMRIAKAKLDATNYLVKEDREGSFIVSDKATGKFLSISGKHYEEVTI